MLRVLAVVGVIATLGVGTAVVATPASAVGPVTWCKSLPPVLREYCGCGFSSQ
jgi:hypothetical protein